ncbi:MAG: GIY-YIG nuclease family protein [Candidatus Paceibacterota bacterium]
MYVLKNEKGGYYVGSTVDLKARIRHHMNGFTPSTSKMGKLELVFSQEYGCLKDARHIEMRIKKLKRKDYIEKIIADGKIKMKIK